MMTKSINRSEAAKKAWSIRRSNLKKKDAKQKEVSKLIDGESNRIKLELNGKRMRITTDGIYSFLLDESTGKLYRCAFITELLPETGSQHTP